MSDLDQTQAPVDGTATKVTHGNDAQSKEDRREGHDRVDLPPPGHLLPLCVARDDNERDQQAYRRIWGSARLVFQRHLRARTD